MGTYLARIHRETSIEGMRPTVTLTLVHDEDAVELVDGDEFVTVTMIIDPWEVQP